MVCRDWRKIWDTAGQERYASMMKTYYRKAKGSLLVYDVTNRASFKGLEVKESKNTHNTRTYAQPLNNVFCFLFCSLFPLPLRCTVCVSTVAQGVTLSPSPGCCFYYLQVSYYAPVKVIPERLDKRTAARDIIRPVFLSCCCSPHVCTVAARS